MKKITDHIQVLFSSYGSVGRIIKRYWRNYGGFQAVLCSPYLHIAYILALFIAPDKNWWDNPLEILPNLLGFSLGGYAIFLAFGDQKFQKLVAAKDMDKLEDDYTPSPYLSFSVAFLHFIIVQLVAIILALIGQSLDIPNRYDKIQCWIVGTFGFISYATFLYALFLAIAATLAIYRLVCLYDKHLQMEDKNKGH